MEVYLKDLAFKNYYTYNEYEDYASGKKIEYLKPEHYYPVLSKILYQIDNGNKPLLQRKTAFPMKMRKPIFHVATERGFCSAINPLAAVYFAPEY